MTKVMAVRIGLAAALGVSLFAGVRPAGAIEYPWCMLDTKMGGETCGFTSFAQCQATSAGIGGVCTRNPRYPEAAPRQHARTPR